MPAATESSLKSKLLGALIAFQFVAILISNFAGFLRWPANPAAVVAERYVEITGQPQWWGMFQSGEMRNSVAWDVKIELPDGRTERVQGIAKLSTDVERLNAPAKWSRRFVYESSILGIDLLLPAEEELTAEHFKTFVDEIRTNNTVYEAFFRTVYEQERKKHADWPELPAEMELVILREPIINPLKPEQPEIVNRWVARWRPGDATADTLPVEAFDSGEDRGYKRFPKP